MKNKILCVVTILFVVPPCREMQAAYPIPSKTAYPIPHQTAELLPRLPIAAFIERAMEDGDLQDYILAQWGKVVGNCPGGVCPLPEPVAAVPVQVNYQRQWYNHDGLTLRQHAEIMHGHSTAGLSDTQVAMLNDHDHNSWGHGGHPVSSHSASATHYRYPVAGRVVRGGAAVVRGTVRVATAPVRFVRQVQPVRRVGRGIIRGVNAVRPINVIRRVRARRCY